MLADYHHYIINYCLRRRTRVSLRLSEEEINAIEATSCRHPRLLKLIAELPTLLERFDLINGLEIGEQHHEALALLRDIRYFRSCLEIWLDGWHARTRSEGREPYTIEPASTMPSYASQVDILSSEVFKTAFCFDGYSAVMGHSRIWLALMTCGIMDVELSMTLAGFEEGHPRRIPYTPETRQSITIHADNACRAFIYCLGPHEGTFHGCLLVGGALGQILRYYRQVGESTRVEWCEAVNEVLKTKGVYI